jgi:hypothetical protein
MPHLVQTMRGPNSRTMDHADRSRSAFPSRSGSRAMFDRNAPRLVARQYLGLPRIGFVFQRAQVGKRTGIGSACQGGGKRRGASAIAALTFIRAASKARNTTQLSQDSGAMD